MQGRGPARARGQACRWTSRCVSCSPAEGGPGEILRRPRRAHRDVAVGSQLGRNEPQLPRDRSRRPGTLNHRSNPAHYLPATRDPRSRSQPAAPQSAPPDCSHARSSHTPPGTPRTPRHPKTSLRQLREVRTLAIRHLHPSRLRRIKPHTHARPRVPPSTPPLSYPSHNHRSRVASDRNQALEFNVS